MGSDFVGYMRMLQTVARSCLLLVGFTVCLIAEDTEAQERIAIRATSPLPANVQDVLTDVGKSTQWALLPGENAIYAMRHHCGGSYTEDYLAQVIELNRELSPLQTSDASRKIGLPPCPQVKAQALVKTFVGDDLPILLWRELGARPDTRLRVCSYTSDGGPLTCIVLRADEAVAKQMSWQVSDFELLDPGITIKLPFSSRWTVITLKEGVGKLEAIQSLQNAAKASIVGSDLIRVEETRPLDLIAPLNSDDPRLAQGNCAVKESMPVTWPFDAVAVRAAVRNAVEYLDGKNLQVSPTIVRIADTGIVGIGDEFGFPERFLAVNAAEIHGERREDLNRPPNGYRGDRYGIDPDNFGNVEALRDQPEWLHGSLVADLALGGRQFRDGTGSLAGLIKLNFARLFENLPGGTRILVNAAAVGNSITAYPQLANIVNLSIGGESPVPSLLFALESLTKQKQVVVIAAGNDGVPLGDKALFPASYGARSALKPAILVVGAHGLDGLRASFSNYGPSHVDLLAPGCRLPSPFSEYGASGSSGTSFAAPFVSFAVSLVRAFLGAVKQEPGGGVNSVELRTRLHASSRFTTTREASLTRFGGILDIPAALRVFDDVVRLTDGSLVVGRWRQPSAVTICANQKRRLLRADLLLRVRVEPSGDGGLPELHVLRRDDDWQFDGRELEGCTAAAEAGPTLMLASGQIRRFRWNEIAAFIPAYDLNFRRAFQAPGAQPAAADSFDAQTQKVMIEMAGHPKSSTAQLKIIQRALKGKGFDPGAIDGLLGSQTYSAIRQFQETRYEQPSGILNVPQLRALLD